MTTKASDRKSEETDYLERFLAGLRRVRGVVAAFDFAYRHVPASDRIGRLRYTNLQHFLGSVIETRGRFRYRISRIFPVVPERASRAERAAYSELVRRLAAKGEFPERDAEYVAKQMGGVGMES